MIKVEKLISEEDKEAINSIQNNSMEKAQRVKREQHNMRISTVKNTRKQMSGKDIKLDSNDTLNKQNLFLEKRAINPRMSK